MSIKRLLEISLQQLRTANSTSEKDLELYELLKSSLTELESLRELFGNETESSEVLNRLSRDVESLRTQVVKSQSQISALAQQLQQERATTQNLTQLLNSLAAHLSSIDSEAPSASKPVATSRNTKPLAEDVSVETPSGEKLLSALTRVLSGLDDESARVALRFWFENFHSAPELLAVPEFFGVLTVDEREAARTLANALRLVEGEQGLVLGARKLADKIEAQL